MEIKVFSAGSGDIIYWTDYTAPGEMTLVFLPGLTADHRLFQRQLESFAGRWRMLAWDPPAHGESRPFDLNFTLRQQAEWLHAILEQEQIHRFCLIGQSMGGYVAQCFLQIYPGEAAGFISIDSAPLKRQYTTGWELWLLRHCQPIYLSLPWDALRTLGATGCAQTLYGQSLMRQMMDDYTQEEYAVLAAFGMQQLADAIAANLPYRVDCPALLLCGKHDRAGSARRYNRAWAKGEGLPLVWVPAAGHNANADNPVFVNRQIDMFVHKLCRTGKGAV